MAQVNLSSIELLHTVNFEGKSAGLKFADNALYLASAALGYQDLTLKKGACDPDGNPIFESVPKVNNVFVRFLAGLAAIVVLPITLVGLVVKWCLQNKQTEQIQSISGRALPSSEEAVRSQVKSNEKTGSKTPEATPSTKHAKSEDAKASTPNTERANRDLLLKNEEYAAKKLQQVQQSIASGVPFAQVRPILTELSQLEYLSSTIKPSIDLLYKAGEKNEAIVALRKEVQSAIESHNVSPELIAKVNAQAKADTANDNGWNELLANLEVLFEQQNLSSSETQTKGLSLDAQAIKAIGEIKAERDAGAKFPQVKARLQALLQYQYANPNIKKVILELLALGEEEAKVILELLKLDEKEAADKALQAEGHALLSELKTAFQNQTLTTTHLERLQSLLSKTTNETGRSKIQKLIRHVCIEILLPKKMTLGSSLTSQTVTREEVDAFFRQAEIILRDVDHSPLKQLLSNLLKKQDAEKMIYDDWNELANRGTHQRFGFTNFSDQAQFIQKLKNDPSLVLHRMHQAKNMKSLISETDQLRAEGDKEFNASSYAHGDENLFAKINDFYKFMTSISVNENQGKKKMIILLSVPGAREYLIADWRITFPLDLTDDEDLINKINDELFTSQLIAIFLRINRIFV